MQFLAAPKIPVVGSLPAGGNVGELVYYNGSFYRWTGAAWTQFVNSVAGKTGAVTLDKADVGLGNVDNTSDLAKPISTATQTALDDKLDDADAGVFGLSFLGSDTSATATLLLDTFTVTEKGLVPAPSSSTGRYLKDDGTWDSIALPTVSPSWEVTTVSTGSSQVITLPESDLGTDDVLVTIEGLLQNPSDYAISGTDLTLTADDANLSIVVRRIGGIVNGGGGGGGTTLGWQEITLVNPSAETGDVTGWTQLGGGFTAEQANPTGHTATPYSGSWMFVASSNPAPKQYQDIDVSADSAAIDAGDMEYRATAMVARTFTDTDSVQIQLHYLDVSNDLIYTATTSYGTGTTNIGEGVWTFTDVTSIAPVGTRTVRVQLLGSRIGGTNNNCAADDIHLYQRTLSPTGTGGSIDGLTDVDTSTTAPQDGDTLVWSTAASSWVPGASLVAAKYRIAFSIEETIPNAAEVLLRHVFDSSVTFSDDFVGSVGRIAPSHSAPATDQVLPIKVNDVEVGNVTVLDTGTVVFATTAGSLTVAVGDELRIEAPVSSPDPELIGVSITLTGVEN